MEEAAAAPRPEPPSPPRLPARRWEADGEGKSPSRHLRIPDAPPARHLPSADPPPSPSSLTPACLPALRFWRPTPQLPLVRLVARRPGGQSDAA